MKLRVGTLTNPTRVHVRVVRLFGWRATIVYEWPTRGTVRP